MNQEMKADRAKLLYVMVVVFIVCGGNGVGLLAGALIWRFTQRLVPAIVALAGLTLLALGLAAGLVLCLRRLAAQDRAEEAAAPKEE